MKVYEAYFNFEVDKERSDSSIAYPTLAEARREAIAQLKHAMAERLEEAHKYDTTLDADSDKLTAQISLIQVVPINAQSLCHIINSSGGGYSQSEHVIMNVTLPGGALRPIIERVKETQNENPAK